MEITKLQEFDNLIESSHYHKCKFCDGLGEIDDRNEKIITVFGRDFKNIAEIITYAYQHGYEDK